MMAIKQFMIVFVVASTFLATSNDVFAQRTPGIIQGPQTPSSPGQTEPADDPQSAEPGGPNGQPGIPSFLGGDSVLGRHLFYNDSSFDTASDADAIAPDVVALKEGETASFANYSSYLHGINGIIIDVDNLPNGISINDFELKVGNDDFPDQWSDAPTPTVEFTDGGGVDGSDRVKLIWTNGDITKCWLKVRLIASQNTGLAQDDVFYFGSVVGETGNSAADALVNVADIAGVRLNLSGFSMVGLDNNYDFNRDGHVSVDDIAATRLNSSGFTPVKLITPLSNKAESADLGRGTNFGNMLEAPNEGDWGFFVEEIFFDKVVEAQLDFIRLPISWTNHASTTAPYTIDEAFFERVDWCVQQAKNRNLKIIVNVHHYDELNDDPTTEWARALAIWNQIATRYQSEPSSVFFEILNEPHGAFNADPTLWNAFMVDALDVIRATNPSRKVLVGPVNFQSVSALDSFIPPLDMDLIVSVHYYEPFNFTHQGAEWVDPSPAVGTTWDGARLGYGSGWQNWSWNSTINATTSGLEITYNTGWAGVRFHSNSPIEGANELHLTTNQAMNLNLHWLDTNGDDHSTVLQTQAGTNDYVIDLDAIGNPLPITDVTVQNNTPEPTGTVNILELRLCGVNANFNLVDSQEAAVRNSFKAAAKWSIENGLPMHLGEFGAYRLADMPSRVRWTAAVREACEDYNIDWTYWEMVAGFGFYDPSADTWRTDLLQALVPGFGN